MRKDGERGFILVAALWLVAALAVLASVYARYADNVALSTRLHADDFQIEAAERSAIEAAAERLGATPANQRPAQGAFRFAVGAADVEVAYIDEAARIDLNDAPLPLLAKLFVELGEPEDAARDNASRVVAWRKRAESDGKSEAYRSAGLAYPPRNAPFQDTLELSLVRGLSPDLVQRALPFVTVFAGAPGIDLRSASATVLSALPDLDLDHVAQLIRARQDPSINDDVLSGMLGRARAYASTERRTGCRVDVAVRLADGRTGRAEIVILPTPSDGEPYRVLAWSDD